MTDAGGENLKVSLDVARRAIAEHRGYKEHQALEALHLSLAGVFVPNWRTLLAFLDAAATNEELAIELIQNVRKPVVREKFQANTTRHLYVTVTPEHRVEVSRRLESEFNNGHEYLSMHGTAISLPQNIGDVPAKEFLEWHNENRFVA